MSGCAKPRVLVSGIGNPDRGDDGCGLEVVRRLRSRLPCGVRVIARSGDALALIEDWQGFAVVVVVDAAAAITRPGTIHRLDLTDSPLPAGFAISSTHAIGVAEAVELARCLRRLPCRLVAYLVEGERFTAGAPLSPAVAEALDEVVERIVVELSDIFASPGAREGVAEDA